MSLEDMVHVEQVADRGSEVEFSVGEEVLWAPFGARGAFGGQLAGIGLYASGQTVDESVGFVPHAFFSTFLRPGEVGEGMQVIVRRTRDGRTYCVREYELRQRGKAILVGSCSFHAEKLEGEGDGGSGEGGGGEGGVRTGFGGMEMGTEGGLPMYRVRSSGWESNPEELLSPIGRFEKLLSDPRLPEQYRPMVEARKEAQQTLVDIRYPSPLSFTSPTHTAPQHQSYFRFTTPTPPSHTSTPTTPSPLLRAVAITYATDFPLLQTATFPYGRPNIHVQMLATLNFCLYFHNLPLYHPSQWALCVADATSLRYARGLTKGLVFDRENRLIASAVQEGVVRLAKGIEKL